MQLQSVEQSELQGVEGGTYRNSSPISMQNPVLDGILIGAAVGGGFGGGVGAVVGGLIGGFLGFFGL